MSLLLVLNRYPWDYSASEYGWKDNFNIATAFIDLFAQLGLVYDRKVVPKHIVEKRMKRTGDGMGYKRPKHKSLHFILGLIYITWPLWLSFIISLFIRN